MRNNEPPKRFPADQRAPASVGANEPVTSLPPYSARWATGRTLIIAAVILLLIAAGFAKFVSRSVNQNVHAGPVVR